MRGSSPPYAFGNLCTASSALLRTISGARPSLASTAGTIVSSWRIIAAIRWSGVSSGLLSALA